MLGSFNGRYNGPIEKAFQSIVNTFRSSFTVLDINTGAISPSVNADRKMSVRGRSQ